MRGINLREYDTINPTEGFMEFQEIDTLFKKIEEIPDGNLGARIQPWNEIKTKLDNLEEDIQSLEEIIDNDDDIIKPVESNPDINLQENLDTIQSSIEKIKRGGLTIKEVSELYKSTINDIQQCKGEINETSLRILKSDNTGSLTEVSM